MLINTGFIVTDGNAIWGAGETVNSAIEDAANGLILHMPLNWLKTKANKKNIGCTANCS